MKLDNPILAKYDVSGIQDYIFATNRLRENIGASNNVGRVLKQLLPEAIQECAASDSQKTVYLNWKGKDPAKEDPTEEDVRFMLADHSEIAAEILYIGGGNAVVIYQNEMLYNKVSRQLAIKTAEQCQGITVTAAGVSMEGDYSEDMERLNQELAVIKRKLKREVIRSPYPIVEQDSSYGIPVTHKMPFQAGHSPNVSTVQYQKYMASNRSKEDENGCLDYASQMEELILKRGVNSYVAVVHIDGNGMGELINSSLKEKRTYEEAVPAMRILSSKIAKVNKAAFKEMEAVLAKASGQKPLPFRRLIMDGDDLTFLCGAQYGLGAVEVYLRRLLQMADKHFPVSACAGIAFVHSHFPFRIAYQIAEECCANAKKSWYEERSDNREAGYLDFHVVQGAYVQEMKNRREKEKERIRPFRVTRDEDHTRPDSIDSFKRILRQAGDQDGEGKWPRSRLKKLYEAYLQGSDAVDLLKREFASRGYELSQLSDYFDGSKPCGIFDAMEIMDLYDGDIDREFSKAQERGRSL